MVQTITDGCSMYKLCTVKVIISTLYHAQDILDLRKSNFAELRDIDLTTLPTMAFIQACKGYKMLFKM